MKESEFCIQHNMLFQKIDDLLESINRTREICAKIESRMDSFVDRRELNIEIEKLHVEIEKKVAKNKVSTWIISSILVTIGGAIAYLLQHI
jgi:regulator of replication initiation timing